MASFKDFTKEEVNRIIERSWKAFEAYRKYPLQKRAAFMRAIATEMEKGAKEVVPVAMKETHLPEPRLQSEFTRTLFQLNSYAEACERGSWLEARIDMAIPDRNPPRPDIRKTMIPLGPVAVFGASNFPFAYSTAGGDTACALAAGCSVVVKAHPAHAATSEWVANAVHRAARQLNMPDGIFGHVHGAGFETGQTLVTHPYIKAVGFTGSYSGGKALFDWANQRKDPIPVFAEMGSINPVYLLPQKLQESAVETAKMYAASITLGTGQFCTNPGLIIGIAGAELDRFIAALSEAIKQVAPSDMLHTGIAKAFAVNRAKALMQEQVTTVAVSVIPAKEEQGIPTIASASASTFLGNPILHQEVFGPYSLVIKCENMDEMLQVALAMEGQLTSTLMATAGDIRQYETLVDTVKQSCGRIIINGVPTGVEVCLSMHHGGPFPATTDSRFTSVGADGIQRFARPVSFQNWPDELLPDELKNSNPLQVWRTVNNELTQQALRL
ncbi:MAG: aldehyde dehydrogenase (NADP(+)) [Chitinophagaceae bacterium]|nr:aldehyde dehydrogenase (NADP(+)) [Chitinophagaceae bacterium]